MCISDGFKSYSVLELNTSCSFIYIFCISCSSLKRFFVCFNSSSCSKIWWAILLNDNMDLHMSSLGILVPGPSFVFYVTSVRFTEVWHIIWFFTGTLVWYHTYTSTQTHIAHSETSRQTHPYKYIFTLTVMCSQWPPLLH